MILIIRASVGPCLGLVVVGTSLNPGGTPIPAKLGKLVFAESDPWEHVLVCVEKFCARAVIFRMCVVHLSATG